MWLVRWRQKNQASVYTAADAARQVHYFSITLEIKVDRRSKNSLRLTQEIHGNSQPHRQVFSGGRVQIGENLQNVPVALVRRLSGEYALAPHHGSDLHHRAGGPIARVGIRRDLNLLSYTNRSNVFLVHFSPHAPDRQIGHAK